MANNIQVSLSFTADTAKAKAQIQELQASLNNLMKASPNSFNSDFGTKKILEAQQAAAKLSMALKDATNVNTGKLNLTQFNTSLKQSGMSLEAYRKQMQVLGHQGEQTFLQLAQSVMSANVSLKNSNKLLDSFWNALKQTAKYQISAGVFRGFTSGITSAINYAEDLNESLTNIQIVTNKTTEDMARFARQANKAAKELSTTTTGYTDASLIYFQQGLSDAEVKARTDITIKAANAAGAKTEEMADYLTAVWNSYKVGAEDLERYTDIMAALGAGTATSLEEISTAMEKVASVGEATGVKFEQLSSIIATVSSVTRTSAESVGTAYKTIFARMADLKLEGSVEEDGVTTTLGTVSEQLAQVGVNILDANGDLREMGSVLEELMGKWNSMNGATQQAVAIALAGKRQYTQLLALMNNQDMYFDAMNMAENSEGTTNKQAEIYAKSWEAAQKRVKTAAQGIYDSLLNDSWFIAMNNGFAGVLGLIEKFVDSMGGPIGVLGALGTILTKVFSKQITDSIAKTTQSLYSMSSAGKRAAENLKQEAFKQADIMLSQSKSTGGFINHETEAYNLVMKDRIKLYNDLTQKAKTMSDEEIRLYQHMLDVNDEYGKRLISANNVVDATEREVNTQKQNLLALARADSGAEGVKKIQNGFSKFNKNNWKNQFSQIDTTDTADFESIKNGLSRITPVGKEAEKTLEGFQKTLRDIEQSGNKTGKEFEELKKSIQGLQANGQKAIASFLRVTRSLNITDEAALEFLRSTGALTDAQVRAIRENENYGKSVDMVGQKLKVAKTGFQTFAQGLNGVFQGVSSFTMGITSLRSAFETVSNPDMTNWEKITSILMSLSMGIPSLIHGLSMLKTSWGNVTEGISKAAVAMVEATALQAAEVAGNEAVALSETQKNAIKQAGIATQLQYILAQKLGIQGIITESGALDKNTLATKLNAIATGELTLSTRLMAAAQALLNGQLMTFWTLIWPVLAVLAAVAAAVALVVVGFQAWKNSTPEEQLKKAEENAIKAGEAFEKVSQRVDELREKIQSLQDGYKTIQNLAQGTEEWANKISEINEKALELLDLYPQLSQYTTIGEGGLIQISDKGLQNIENMEVAHQNAAYASKLTADVEENKAKIRAEETNFFNPNSVYIKNDTDYTGAGKQINSYPDLYELLANEYNKEGVGASLFTKTGMDKFFEEAYGTFEENYKNLKEGTNEYDESLKAYNKKMQVITDAILKNQDQVVKIANLKKTNEVLESTKGQSVITQTASSMGSLMTGEDLSKLGVSYDKIRAQKEKEVKDIVNKGGGLSWQDHIDYKGTEQWIQDFMAGQGPNTEYVAQRKGQMVIKIDGEEQEFSKDDVLNYLTEFYSSKELRGTIVNAFRENLKGAFGDDIVKQMSEEDLASLSNLKDIIADSIIPKGTDEETQKKLNDYMTELSQLAGGPEQLSAMASNLYSAPVEALEELRIKSLQLDEGKISLEDFFSVFQKTDALGRLEELSSSLDAFAELHDLDADQLKEYSKYIMEIAEESDELADGLATDADAASDLAKQILRMNKGVETLADNFEDWSDILNNSSKESVEYMESLSGLREAIGDLLNINGSELSGDFIKENLDLIGKAAEGNGEAIDELRSKLDEEIIAKVTMKMPNIKEKIITLDNDLKSMIEGLPDIEIEAKMNSAEFLEAANKLVDTANMTADDANAYFAGIGYEPVYSTEEIPAQGELDVNSKTKTVLDSFSLFDGYEEVDMGPLGKHPIPKLNPNIVWHSETAKSDPTPIDNTIPLVSFSGDGSKPPPKIRGFRKKASGSMNNYSSANKGGGSPRKSGGGGGSKKSPAKAAKPQKTDKIRYQDEVERYKDSNNLLERHDRLLQRIQREKEELYGKNYIDAIDKENKAIDQQNKLLEQQIEEAKKYSKQDKDYLINMGLNVEVDDDGNILNIEDIQRQIVDLKNAENSLYDSTVNSYETQKVDSLNGLAEDAEEEQKTSIEDNYDNLKTLEEERHKQVMQTYDDALTAIDGVEEAQNIMYDNAEKREENLQQKRANNYEKITYKLEKLLQITENENKLIEAQSAFLEESFKNAPELFDNNLKTTENMLDNLDYYRNLYKEIQSLSSEKLTDTDRMDGIQQAFDGILDTVSSLTEQADYFKNAYSEALGQVQEETEKLYSQFDHFISLTENYENILGLLNRSTDYETLNNILKARQQLQQEQYQASKEDYEMLLGQIAQARQAQAAALSRGDQEAADVYKNTIENLTVAVHEAQATMIDNVQAWLEGIAKVRDTAIAAARQVLESSLTNGSTFNEFNQELEYLQAKQEDYLTETNQQYETQKLIRTAMLDIEKTENQVAKNKLNAYIKETEELQKQERLSNFELEVQQAKYDLLLAEIALQEAQDAKSQVRLQRDSEGNFNYVYTADQNKIAEAESKYADAENNLYNIRLEGANEYAQKYYELMQEMADKMAEIQEDETLRTEEKNRRMEELYDQYYSRLKDMQSIYNIAAIGLDDDLNEAISANMMDNIASLSDFKEATQQYLSDCETAQNEWQDNADTVSGLVSGDFQAVKEKSGELKKGIEDLRKDSEYNLNSIQSKTQSWAETMAGHLQSVKSEAMLLANAFQTVLAAASGFSNTNYMAEYDSATNVIDAFSSLNARDFKIANDKELADQYGTTAKALMESDRDQSNQIQNASSKAEAIAAAARREAKLEYLKRHDTKLYNQLIAGFKTEDLLANEAINISQEEAKQLVAEMRRQLQYFDTGGYTGEFGPEGRLAMLHQKEIVLNSQDTANLLDTVDIVRKLIDNIEYKALMSSFGSINIPSSFGNTNKDVVEQEVTIHAEFPNVQHSNEIEEAFNNLVNRASQFANRKSY